MDAIIKNDALGKNHRSGTKASQELYHNYEITLIVRADKDYSEEVNNVFGDFMIVDAGEKRLAYSLAHEDFGHFYTIRINNKTDREVKDLLWGKDVRQANWILNYMTVRLDGKVLE